MKWVPASERLPEDNQPIFIKNNDYKNVCCHVKDRWYDYENNILYLMDSDDENNKIEWLDEQPSQSNVSEDKSNYHSVCDNHEWIETEVTTTIDSEVLKSTTCRNCGISKPAPVSEDVGKKCVAGCKNYTGYETYHHKDCPFYPDSFSERFDKLNSEWQKQQDKKKIPKIKWNND